MLTFYEVLDTLNGDLSTVAFLIAYFRDDSVKRVMSNLEVSKVKPYNAELEKILDLKMNTIKDLIKVRYER
jgi:predicted Zn-dependent protease